MNLMLHPITGPVLFAIAALATAYPAAAQPQAADHDAPPRIELDLNGVDLGTTEGIDLARRRISGPARAVCSTLPDPDGWHLQTSACVSAARDQANRQLTALHEKALAQRAARGKSAVQTASLIP